MTDIEKIVQDRVSGVKRELNDIASFLERNLEAISRALAALDWNEQHPERVEVAKGKVAERKQRPSITEERVRDYILEKRVFSAQMFSEDFGVSTKTVRERLQPFIEREVLKVSKGAGRGRAFLYTYQEPEASESSVVTLPPEGQSGALPIKGTGRPLRATNSEIRKMLRAARKAGMETAGTSGHHKVRNPKTGREITLPNSPSPASIMQARVRLRELGVQV